MTPHDHPDTSSTDADAYAPNVASGPGRPAEHDGQPEETRGAHLTPVTPLTSPDPRGALDAMRAGGGAGHCRFPGCTQRRQPRLNRRGAPPAYCTDPDHHPDGARRERIRRRRLGLPLEAILDQHDQPLPAVSSLPPDDPAAERAERAERAEEDERAELPGGSGPSWAASAGPVLGPELAVVLPLDRASGGGVVVNPAEHARRLADQLALAATAYEQVAEQTAELQAANIELTRRLAATSSLSTDSSTDPSTDSSTIASATPEPRPCSSASPDAATGSVDEHDSR